MTMTTSATGCEAWIGSSVRIQPSDIPTNGAVANTPLATSCAEASGAPHPQDDRHPVAESADDQRPPDRTGAECRVLGVESDEQVGGACDDTFGERDLRRCRPGRRRGQVVVESQHTHAPTTSSAPNPTPPPRPPSSTPAVASAARPEAVRRPMCSPKNSQASSAVATNSRFNSNDAVDAGVRSSPVNNSTGAIAPPMTNVSATFTRSRLDGRAHFWRATTGTDRPQPRDRAARRGSPEVRGRG